MSLKNSVRNAGFIGLILFASNHLSCSKSNPTSPAGPTPTPTFPAYSASATFGNGTSPNMDGPAGIGISGSGVWVMNYNTSVFQEWTTTGSFSTSITGYGSGPTNFNHPWGVAVGPDGYIYAADQSNKNAVEFTPAGQYATIFGSNELGSDLVLNVAVNSPHAYLLDYMSGLVIGYNISGSGVSKTFTSPITFGNSGTVTLCSYSLNLNQEGPYGICLDKSGNVYVADTGNARVLKFGPTGNYQSAVTNGLNSPAAVVVDSNGNLFVSDLGDGYIHPYTSAGIAKIPFGGSELGGNCYGLALDSKGSLYATSFDNNEVVVFKSN